jgi:hypothetical protein
MENAESETVKPEDYYITYWTSDVQEELETDHPE